MGRIVFIAAGMAGILIAIAGPQLGLDPNEDWGPARSGVLLAGLVLASIPLAEHFLHEMAADLAGLLPRRRTSAVGQAIGGDAESVRARTRWALVGMLAAWIVVQAVYVWIGTVGRWSSWPETTHYYDLLAEGFLRGSLALPVEPDPALAALANPYDPAARAGIPWLVDASYYGGKYYLYWGPVPGILAALGRAVAGVSIGDHFLVWLGASLASLSGGLALLSAWRARFMGTAWWTVPALGAGMGLINPMPWLLGRPAVYEAASALGQGFLITAALVLLPIYLGGAVGVPRLVAGSVLLGLAVGSRAALLPCAALLVVAVLWMPRAAQGRGSNRRSWPTKILAIAGPLGLCLVLLGGYNFARFGTAWEFGQKYALASADLTAESLHVFSIRYVPPNLYNYLARPVRSLTVFPFFKPNWGLDHVPYLGLRGSSRCYPLQVTGILVSSPFAWLALLPVAGMLFERKGAPGRAIASPGAGGRASPAVVVLAGASAAALAPVLLYCAATMHYLADAVPMIFLLTSVLTWEMLSRTEGRSRRLLQVAVVALLVGTVTMGVLLGVSGYDQRFEKLNPELFDWITRLLAW